MGEGPGYLGRRSEPTTPPLPRPLVPDAVYLKWSNDSGHLVKGINYPNEVNNESRETSQKEV